MTSFYELLQSGRVLSEDEWNRYILSFHQQDPASTARVMSRLVDEQGASSYDKLAQLAEPGLSVLDLGCGSGELLQLIRERIGLQASLFGLDPSSAELAHARAKDRDAKLLCHSAQQIPLSSESLDLVVSHMVLMCLRPLTAAVKEIARVLKVGGKLAAVVTGVEESPGLWTEYQQQIQTFFVSRYPNFGNFRTGDPRAYTMDGLSEVLAPIGRAHVENFSIAGQFNQDQLWDFAGSTYLLSALNADDRALLERTIKDFAQTRLQGQKLHVPLRLVTVYKSESF